jgi:peptidoglycan hydrolase-like protein with peptidoglycan-binding domain
MRGERVAAPLLISASARRMKMRQALLATVAAAALGLSVPAIAQSSDSQSAPDQQQSQTMQKTPDQAIDQGQMQDQSQMQGMQNQASAQPIQPTDLSKQQIRDLQQALNQKGFDTGHVDGIWGPETRTALRDFQKQQNMQQANGRLNEQTLQALGVNTAQNGQNNQQQPSTVGSAPSPSNSTTGAAPSEDNNSSGQNGMSDQNGSTMQNRNGQPQDETGQQNRK